MHGLSLGAHNTDGHISWFHPGHSHHAHHSQRSELSEHHDHSSANQVQDNSVSGGGATQGSVKQAVVNQIRATLSQRFELHQTSVSVVGATAAEQAVICVKPVIKQNPGGRRYALIAPGNPSGNRLADLGDTGSGLGRNFQ